MIASGDGELVAGVDVGNGTTEVALALVRGDAPPEFLSTALRPTSGLKGTVETLPGIEAALADAVARAGCTMADVALVLLNDAAPVVADVAMQTITETVVTESTMVGHNPSTPGGYGLGTGRLVPYDALAAPPSPDPVVVAVPESVRFSDAARGLATAMERGWPLVAAIVQHDDGVLIANRLPLTDDRAPLPIVDEVSRFELLPYGQQAVVEVARPGHSVHTLSNPYALAGLLALTPQETARVVPIARALAGLRSGVVIRLPPGQAQGRIIRAGGLAIRGRRSQTVDTRAGAEAIMHAVDEAWPLDNVEGEAGTNVGAMLGGLRATMCTITGEVPEAVRVRDLLAVDLLVPRPVEGAITAGATLEAAVGLAALVHTSRRPMAALAAVLAERLQVQARVGGVEAAMALRGALTSPGVGHPVAVVDMGAGSVDAATGWGDDLRALHLAGAGELVTVLIDAALGLGDRDLAEEVKRRPAALVEDVFRLRLEDGTTQFLDEPASPRAFGRLIVLGDGERTAPTILPPALTLDAVRTARRACKEKVLVRNTLRALRLVTRFGDVRELSAVVLVGGCALDFEAPEMITRRLAEEGLVAGCAQVRRTAGPRNAVATGLVLAYAEAAGVA